MPSAGIDLDSDLVNLPRARRFVSDLLQSWGRDQTLQPVLLLTTELVSNAVRHGDSPIRLMLQADGSRVRVEVSDGSTRPPVMRAPDLAETGGRGLHFVDTLSEAWGHEHNGAGKRVWFEVMS